jgi:hypothetical protein
MIDFIRQSLGLGLDIYMSCLVSTIKLEPVGSYVYVDRPSRRSPDYVHGP